VLLVVDAVEGVMVGTERAIKAAAVEGLPICLLIAKFDRCDPGKYNGTVQVEVPCH
jgi:translation elongation factor EF-G